MARIEGVWSACRSRHGGGGGVLFGHITVADAMYAPVASRFATDGPGLGPTARAYVEAVHGLPARRAWLEAARAEPERLVEMEI